MLFMLHYIGMQYFVIEGKKIGISKLWTRGAIWFFLTIVVLGYITTVYLLGKVIIPFTQITIKFEIRVTRIER